MLLLHVPDDQCSVLEEPGRTLRANKQWFASRRAGHAYLGYMQRQRDRMTGERGQMRVNRPELIERHGFDTKYAGHVLRLGYQGLEFLESGRLTLPTRVAERTRVLDVRKGRVTFEEVLAEADELQRRLESLLEGSPLLSLFGREREQLTHERSDFPGIERLGHVFDGSDLEASTEIGSLGASGQEHEREIARSVVCF